jgi:hypothetical protein
MRTTLLRGNLRKPSQFSEQPFRLIASELGTQGMNENCSLVVNVVALDQCQPGARQLGKASLRPGEPEDDKAIEGFHVPFPSWSSRPSCRGEHH